MIFGKTKEQKLASEQAKIKTMIDGVRKFAWLPVRLANGQLVWLQTYYAYYRAGTNTDGTFFIWSSSKDTYFPMSDCYLIPNESHRHISKSK